VRALLFGDTLLFEYRSPVFRAKGGPQQLAAPVYREGDVAYLPAQLFTEWLPARYAEQLGYQGGVLRLKGAPSTVASRTEEQAARQATPPARQATPPARQQQATQPARQGTKAPARRGPRVVVLDAGHGGRDPGKVGPGGVREKDVTLAVARELAAVLRERGGYEVHLTRTADTLIALADRPRIANRLKGGRPAALFLSIHANSGPARAAGFETYFLSEARTDDERRVAEMENAAVEYEEVRAPAPANDREWILQTLRNDFYQRASNDLAEVVQKRLATFHPGPNRGVKQAGFRVLVGAFMPAVLVEMAFISNQHEATLLGSAKFQRQMATALADAVDQYFVAHEHLLVTEGGR
jgi:N-acetylmuramoyl-L-alanine amidase